MGHIDQKSDLSFGIPSCASDEYSVADLFIGKRILLIGVYLSNLLLMFPIFWKGAKVSRV